MLDFSCAPSIVGKNHRREDVILTNQHPSKVCHGMILYYRFSIHPTKLDIRQSSLLLCLGVLDFKNDFPCYLREDAIEPSPSIRKFGRASNDEIKIRISVSILGYIRVLEGCRLSVPFMVRSGRLKCSGKYETTEDRDPAGGRFRVHNPTAPRLAPGARVRCRNGRT